jgi:hypothetical protein
MWRQSSTVAMEVHLASVPLDGVHRPVVQLLVLRDRHLNRINTRLCQNLPNTLQGNRAAK